MPVSSPGASSRGTAGSSRSSTSRRARPRTRSRRSPRGERPTSSSLGLDPPCARRSVAPGSVAEHLLHGARCRLVIAPKGYAQGDHSQDRLRVVGVGYDGMAESHAALDEAARLATKFGASMKVIGVLRPIPPTGRCRRGPGGSRGGTGFSEPPPRRRVPSCPRSCARSRFSRGGPGPEAARGRRGRH